MNAKLLDAGSSLGQWLEHLETLHPVAIDLGLERVQAVLERLNLEHTPLIITVAGTNGKGSSCAMLEAILLAAGYRTGLYTSPHLIHFNERIRLQGEPVTDSIITKQFARIEEARGSISLTYFEFATLAALCIFAHEKLDVAILEAGLGGRLDAVNAVDADCALVTSIDLDHTDWLGDTREAIGLEKAHIFRPGKPAVCSDPVPPKSLCDYAEAIGADLWLSGRDFNYSGDRQQWAYGGRQQRRSSLAYPALRGANQLLNAAGVLAVLETLRMRLVVPQQAVRIGLAQVSLPGRFQVLPGTPATILDVAHNLQAAAVLRQNLDGMGFFPQTYAVVGMYKDKAIEDVLLELYPEIDHWYCASTSGPRGLSGSDLAARVRQLQKQGAEALAAGSDAAARFQTQKPDPLPGVKRREIVSASRLNSVNGVVPDILDTKVIKSFDNPVDAFRAVQKQATDNDRILVFGSFTTVGPVLADLGRTVD